MPERTEYEKAKRNLHESLSYFFNSSPPFRQGEISSPYVPRYCLVGFSSPGLRACNRRRQVSGSAVLSEYSDIRSQSVLGR